MTQLVTTVAGTGRAGYNGDNITATSAQLNNPVGIAFDPAGNLYISDNNNARIRRVITTTGIITTYAGTGVSRVITATASWRGNAQLNDPYHISFDPSGNLYIADASNNRIRKVTTAGIITTVAGTGRAGYNGDNQPATAADLNKPLAAVADSGGNLYIADNKNALVRLVSGGTITTYAGTRFIIGLPGDGVPATLAKFKGPNNLGIDAAGNLYIADEDDNKVRQVNKSSLLIHTVAGERRRGFQRRWRTRLPKRLLQSLSRQRSTLRAGYILRSTVRTWYGVSPFREPGLDHRRPRSSPQSTRVNTDFPERLTAAVKDINGIGVPGVTVTYRRPFVRSVGDAVRPDRNYRRRGRNIRFRDCEFDGRSLQRDRKHHRSCDSGRIRPDKYGQCFR